MYLFFARMKNFKFDEGEVLLVRQNSKISAIGSKCTHYGAPLVKGVLGADGTVRCPWHGACFNSTSGEKLIFLTCSYNFLILMLLKIYLLLLISRLFHHAMRLALYIFCTRWHWRFSWSGQFTMLFCVSWRCRRRRQRAAHHNQGHEITIALQQESEGSSKKGSRKYWNYCGGWGRWEALYQAYLMI